ncbi:hypothetical protein [Cupriavidus agavae]|uniref:Uncharacterized protein n=1 Tax=Cupriavidus agavae TaxID=1001822 RepID=A0A4Q7S7X8_9BURK|nr:hypothetical protein [Cupriavidus agavae]RZT42403.1 hypothetical protein EV147_1436 [Cupriavidus agavae]
MFVCQNQPCGAQWAQDEVEIRNEGQGPLFRCPQCGARNPLEVKQAPDGTQKYRQVARLKESPKPARPADGRRGGKRA